MKPQKFEFMQPITFNEASFTIKEVFPGKDNDTAIAEIAFYLVGEGVELNFDRVKPQPKGYRFSLSSGFKPSPPDMSDW